MIFASSIPDVYRLVITGGGKALAVRGPGDSAYPLSVSMIGAFRGGVEDATFGSNIPDMDRLIVTSRGKALTVGGPGDSTYPVRVPAIGEDMVSGKGIPDPSCFVIAGGGKTSAIRR